MKLVVDVGNSRVKWALVDGVALRAGAPIERRGAVESMLGEAWRDIDSPSDILVSSVAEREFDQRLEQWMLDRLACRPRWFRSEPETLGIVNGYADYRQLGSDRWAVILGARGPQPGPLGVIDCGTAITLDVVNHEDRHLGGLIVPGPELARDSLLNRTASIREAGPGLQGLLGRSTAACVANGVGLGLAGALERWMAEVEQALDGVVWLATGGAWQYLSPVIRTPIRYDPHLVLRGLARVLNHGVGPG
jgi:type III pantothenate kinase